MERFWNIVYYFAYRADYRMHLAFNKVNLSLYLYKLPIIKRRLKVDPVKVLDDAYRSPDIGLSSMFAGGLMYGLPFFFLLGLHICFLSELVRKISNNLDSYIIYGYMGVSFLFSHMLLFYKDKYLKYFKEFDKKPREWKVKWA